MSVYVGPAPTSAFPHLPADPLGNSGWIWPGRLARAAQPSTDGFRWLIKEGFHGFIDLRKEIHHRPPPTPGVTNLFLPTADHHPIVESDLILLRDFLSVEEHLPALLFCGAGSGRSGYATAVLRWSWDGWEWPEIKDECESHRVPHWALFWIKWLDPLQRAAFREWMRDHPQGEWK